MQKGRIILGTLFFVSLIITGFTTGEAKVNDSKVFIVNNTAEDEKESPVTKKEEKLTLYKKDVLATYYADKFNGRKTSSGQKFDNNKYTAAHKTLPFGTKVRVTNESNGKFVDVVVNDRGPFSKKLEIDLTKKAFMEIATKKTSGTFKVKIEIIE
jgi:rare lipoprotein A